MPSSEEKLSKLAEFFEHKYEQPNVFMARGRWLSFSHEMNQASHPC